MRLRKISKRDRITGKQRFYIQRKRWFFWVNVKVFSDKNTRDQAFNFVNNSIYK